MTTAMPRSPGAETTGDQDEDRHPLDAHVQDPSGMTPLCGADMFAAIVDGMVADFAPRVFAVVQEYGDRVDARIAAWGIAFDDHAEVVGVDGGLRMSLQTPENALRGFTWGSHITARLVWVNPGAATPANDAEFLRRSHNIRSLNRARRERGG
ncbi:hypothetical protein [Saccharopolyspora phatthalungensis]|uniref:Uncharacterized protein n=1 Tax=Saccharopolyspora phatthalungensis TaxID=664693 RepID=A0A840Q875_9PSEU|nr:hypothetical protein [Saccharopolyspora phatthalungensis]MBB5155941.1 hypothetical protein [Saccharopolyspora phatthalungensis]